MFGLIFKKNSTDFISADTRKCTSCGDCVTACNSGILAIKGPVFHRHIRLANGDSCVGCMKCVEICKNNVFKKVSA